MSDSETTSSNDALPAPASRPDLHFELSLALHEAVARRLHEKWLSEHVASWTSG